MASMLEACRANQGLPAKLIAGTRTGYDLSRVGAGVARSFNGKKKLTASPWSGTWPAPGSSLDLDFANNRGFVRGMGQGGVMDGITYTRASAGWYVDQSGLLVEVANNVPRFDWASTEVVANKNRLINTDTFSAATWTQSNGVLTAQAGASPDADTAYTWVTNNGVVIGSGESSSGMLALPVIDLSSGTVSVYAKSFGARYLCFATSAYSSRSYFDLQDGVVASNSWNVGVWPISPVQSITSVGGGWYRCELYFVAGFSAFRLHVFGSNATGSNPVSDGTGVYLWHPQAEAGETVTDYQAVGAQAPTNTPLVPAPTCNGLLIEEARTNRLLWCRDATQSNWVKTDITAAKDQTGIDGVANAASSLTATADGGTCIQTITLASGSRTGSVFLKRLMGTGIVQVSLDGTTWSTVDLSDTEWRRIVLSGTVTNPVVGIRLATSGDAVAMDFGQAEDGDFATSPILTTGASATRIGDLADVDGPKFDCFYNRKEGSFFVESFNEFINVASSRYPAYLNYSLSIGIVGSFGDPSGFGPQWTLRSGTRGNFTIDAELDLYNGGGTNEQALIANIMPVQMVRKMAASVLSGTSFSVSYFGLVTKSYDGLASGSASYLVANRLRIGGGAYGRFNGTVKRVVYFPKCFSDAALQEFTK